MSHSRAVPVARSEGLSVTEVGDELIVFDEVSHQFHLLERDAAAVWRALDGVRTIEELADSSGLSASEVRAVLYQFSAVDLLAAPWAGDEPSRLLTRRQALQRVGLAAGVLSIIAPVAAAAQSASCVPFNACAPQAWGRSCCPQTSGTTCGQDLIDGSFACFPNQFCADPDFWQVDCSPAGPRQAITGRSRGVR